LTERDDLPQAPRDLVEDPGETYDPRGRAPGEAPLGSTAPGWDHPTEYQGAAGGGPATAGPSAPSGPRFRFRRVVGQGGMGEVWEATQTSLGRTVAVKRIVSARHTDNKIETAREEFRLEAVITAQLEHPNIVPVHDLAEDATGEPLIAMKLVVGEHWGHQCEVDFDELDVDDFLAKHLPVLVDVGHAVAFAHSRGIVHRDVKLSQVMLGEYGEVLLTDWGLAIRFDDDAGEPSGAAACDPVDELDLPTRITARSPMGTPALMAPEQTLATADDVGPWTDVYLLGGCLYRLLTGSYPHRATTGREAFRLAAAGEIEPPGERAPDREMPAELEELCLEALSPEPNDRPPSAMSFVERLQDFLSGAGRRRESTALTTEAAAILEDGGTSYQVAGDCLSLLEKAVSLWGGNPAVQQLRDRAHAAWAKLALDGGDLALARLQAEQVGDPEARRALIVDVDAAEAGRKRRERQRKAALGAVAALLVVVVLGSLEFGRRIAVERDLAVAARDEAERQKAITFESLEGASSLVNYMLGSLRGRLNLERQEDREVARAVGEGVFDYYRAVDSSEFSAELALEHAGQLTGVGGEFSDLGLLEESIELLEKAIEVYRERGRADDPEVAETMVQLAHSNERLDRWDVALEWLDRAEAVLGPRVEEDPESLARALRTRGLVLKGKAEYDESEAAYRRAYDIIAARFGEEDPRIGTFSWALGDLLYDMGRPDEASAYLERGLRFAEVNPGERRLDLFDAVLSMAHVRSQQGQNDEAIALFERATGIATEEFGPDDRMVGMCLFGLGNLYKRMDDVDRAESLFRRGVAIFESFYPPDHHEIGIAYGTYAGIQVLRKDYEGAVRSFRRSIAIVTATQGPYHKHTAVMHGELATAYSKMGKLEESREEYLKAAEALAGGVGLDTFGAGVLFNNLALVEKKLGRFDDAEEHYRRSLEILTGIAGEEHNGVLQIRLNYAALVSDQGRPDEALAIIEAVAEIRRRTMGPDHPEVAKALFSRAEELFKLGRNAEAEDGFREVLRIRGEAHGETHQLTSQTVRSLATLLAEQGRHDEAIALLKRSLEAHREELGEDDGRTGTARYHLGRSLAEGGRQAEAVEQYELALAVCSRAYGPEHPETLVVASDLGTTLLELGRLDEAEPHLLIDYESRKATDGAHSVKAARAARRLARLRAAQGNDAAAVELLSEAAETFDSVLGAEDDETVECRNELDALQKGAPSAESP
jgi:tetratricopeptide (TPR) repeat protein/tRNA A-37 threonylcarbamoyl transferase component Bud32